MTGSATMTYRVFGLEMESRERLGGALERDATAATADPDLSFSTEARTHEHPGRPIYESPLRGPDGDSPFRFHRAGQDDVLLLPANHDFHLGPRSVVCHRGQTDGDDLMRAQLLGPVLGLFAERRGLLMLHAAAVATDDGAVAFLGTPRAGKSTLAAILAARGLPVLTDDLLAVDPSNVAHPSYPEIRLMPEVVRRLIGHDRFPAAHRWTSKLRVSLGSGGLGHFGQALPLRRIYVLDPRNEPTARCAIEGVGPAETIAEMAHHSLLARLLRSLGLDGPRLGRLAALSADVRTRRITFRAGLPHIDDLAAAILMDLDDPLPRAEERWAG